MPMELAVPLPVDGAGLLWPATELFSKVHCVMGTANALDPALAAITERAAIRFVEREIFIASKDFPLRWEQTDIEPRAFRKQFGMQRGQDASCQGGSDETQDRAEVSLPLDANR